MTVEANPTSVQHLIAGVGPYPFNFRIFAETDLALKVLTGDTPAVPTTLTQGTHFIVSGVNNAAGGTVTLLPGAADLYDGFTLDVRSNTPLTQPTSIINVGRFLPEIHQEAFDRLARQLQDMDRRVRNAIRLPDYINSSGELAPLSSYLGKYLFISAAGVLEPATVVGVTALSQNILAELLWPQEPEEAARGALPANKGRLFGDIRRYGGVSGTDCTAAAQLMLDVCGLSNSNAHEAHIPGGFDAQIYEPLKFHPRQMIRGEGPTSIFNSYVTDGYCLDFDYANEAEGPLGISMRNFRVSGANHSGTGGGIHWTGTGHSSRLQQLWVRDFSGVAQIAVSLTGMAYYVVLEQMELAGNTVGLKTDGDTLVTNGGSPLPGGLGEQVASLNGIWVVHPRVDGGAVAGATGISAVHSPHFHVLGGYCESCSTRGINIDSASAHALIEGTWMERHTLEDIRLQGKYGTVRHTNQVRQSSHTGNTPIQITGANCEVDGCQFSGRSGATNEESIYLNTASRALIRRCEHDGSGAIYRGTLASNRVIEMTTGGRAENSDQPVYIQTGGLKVGNDDTRDVLILNDLLGKTGVVYDPPSLADGARTSVDVTITGASMGNRADASFTNDLQGINMWAEVQATGNVRVFLENRTGGTLNLASGQLTVWVLKT